MHARARANKREGMDWSSLTLETPTLLWLAPLALAVCALAAVAGAMHDRRTRVIALALRAGGILALCWLLAGPQVVQSQRTTFEPVGTWRLLMHEAPAVAGTTDFREPAPEFVARVRNALTGGTPPQRCVIAGSGAEARAVCDSLAALGMPVELVQPMAAAPDASSMLLGFDAPRAIQPGEPLTFSLRLWGPGEPRLTLDDKPLPFARQGDRLVVNAGALEPGRHVIVAELDGRRIGHVLRVGPKPRLVLLGLDDRQAADAGRLVPDFAHERCALAEFEAARIEGAQVVLATVQALYGLKPVQAFALSAFVGRGGGLYVTGDGAKYVPPEFLADDIKALLPVRLLPEPKPEDPPEPPVKEEPTIEEIAKVSVCYVLDRSNSMNAFIGDTRTTRWQVATQGVLDSMAKLSNDARASVMTFTLTQNWLSRPRVFLEHNRVHELGPALRKAASDNEYDEALYNTDIYAAIKAAIDVMKDEPSAVKLIIMLTDGADRPANLAAGLKHTDLRDIAISKGVNIVSVGIGEAFGADLGATGAQNVIRDLATQPDFAFMASNTEDALKAHTIFVNSVSTAFRMFDDKKAREEAERKRKLEDLAAKQKEPPKIEALKGSFSLQLDNLGRSLFGADVLGSNAPKVQWFARHELLPETAVALSIESEGSPAALAFGSHGLGRTAFWSAGMQAESLGEVAGWAEFPGMFAATVRWLTPREVPDLRLVGAATPEGIELLDPLEGATYLARSDSGEVPLRLLEGRLVPQSPLPQGPHEIMETTGAETRSIGDVYVSRAQPQSGRFERTWQPASSPQLRTLPPVETRTARAATLPIALLLGLFLLLMPIERLARRRS